MEMENNNAHTEEETLNKFFNDLYAKKLGFTLNEYEVLDIRNAVIVMVHNIAGRTGNIDQRFKIGKVIVVGSDPEGTQIVQPKDYDFHLVIEELSHEDILDISSECPDKEGCVHTRLKKTDTALQWKQLLCDGNLVSTNGTSQSTHRYGFRQEFHKALQTAVESLKNEQIQMKTGILHMKKVITKHGPAFTLSFTWQHQDRNETLEIFVDLCPVIRVIGQLDQIIKLTDADATCDVYFDYIKKVGSLMLIPCSRTMSCKSGLCFRMTFTSAEILLVRDMSAHHRKCYKILKYILNGILARTATVFHSYALKTLVLNHHYKEQCTEENSIAKCVLMILMQIQDIVQESPRSLMRYDMRKQLPSLFIRNLSVWNHEQSILDSDIKIRLSRLMNRLKRISNMKEYAFEKCYIRSVNCSNLNRLYVPIGFILYEALDHIFEKQ